MNQSEQINELSKALSNAQKVMKGAKKNKRSHHGEYADINSVLQSCKNSLSENELSIMQGLGITDGKLILYTQLSHSSGQWVRSCCFVESEAANRGISDLQATGKALSYMKRYSLCSLIGLEVGEHEDDDGDSEAVAVEAAAKTKAVKAAVKAIEQKTITPVSTIAAKELKTLLAGCEPKFIGRFDDWLKKRVPHIESIDEMPIEMYDQVKTRLLNKHEEHQATQEEVKFG